MTDVTTLDSYAHDLLVAAQLAVATTVGGPIDHAYVGNAIPALDCCPQLTVDVRSLLFENTAPTTPLPAIRSRTTMVGYFLALFVITVTRCSPSLDGRGNPPSVTDLEATSRETNEDLWAIWNTIQTLLRDNALFGGRCAGAYLDPPVPVNDEGKCAGWAIQVRAPIDGYPVVLPS